MRDLRLPDLCLNSDLVWSHMSLNMNLRIAFFLLLCFLTPYVYSNTYEIECVCNIAGDQQITVVIPISDQDLQYWQDQNHIAGFLMDISQGLLHHQLTQIQLHQAIQQIWGQLLEYFSN